MERVSLSIIIAIVGIILISSLPIFAKKCNNRGPSTAFLKAVLDTHNNFRAKHKDTPPLALDDELNKLAKQCAQNVVGGKQGLTYECRKEIPGYGFNDYELRGFHQEAPSAESVAVMAVEQWYSEIQNYSYDDPERQPVNPKEQHYRFTQVVWKNTKKLGCGEALQQDTNMYRYVVICLYNPPGNERGSFAENVMPLK